MTPLLSDLQRMEMATAEEEAKRERALERLAAEAGETKWVLSTVPVKIDNEGGVAINVARTGYGIIDEGVDVAVDSIGGRRSFGGFDKGSEVRVKESMEFDLLQANITCAKLKDQRDTNCRSPQNSAYSGNSSGDGAGGEDGGVRDAADDSDGDPAGTQDLIQAVKGEIAQRAKAERTAKRKAEKQEMSRLAAMRKSKDVNLNRLSSVSGGGGNRAGSGKNMSNTECFNCGEKGHEKRDCPEKLAKRDRETGSRRDRQSRVSSNP